MKQVPLWQVYEWQVNKYFDTPVKYNDGDNIPDQLGV